MLPVSAFLLTGRAGGLLIDIMFFKPKCTPDQALDQSDSTVRRLLGNAIDMLDDCFGKGYAEKNPELVAAITRTQAYDFRTTILLDGHYEISEALREIANR